MKTGDDQTFETIRMNVDELLYFLQTVQEVSLLDLILMEEKISFLSSKKF